MLHFKHIQQHDALLLKLYSTVGNLQHRKSTLEEQLKKMSDAHGTTRNVGYKIKRIA